MEYRHSFLNRMKPRDRLVINLLRGNAGENFDGEVLVAFQAFLKRTEQLGLQAQAAEAPIVSADEFAMLGLLALLQRDRLEIAAEIWRPATPEGLECARLLDKFGHRLDYSHVARLKSVTELPAHSFSANALRMGGNLPKASGEAVVRIKVVEALRSQGPLTMQTLARLGAGRQTIHALLKLGLIKRIRFGLYAVAPDKH